MRGASPNSDVASARARLASTRTLPRPSSASAAASVAESSAANSAEYTAAPIFVLGDLLQAGRDYGERFLAALAPLRISNEIATVTSTASQVFDGVAKGEFAAGFAVPSYMAFEDRLGGFELKYVAPKTAWITPEPMAILAGTKRPRAARAFVEYMLSERGQRVAMERGVFPITPKFRVQGAPGSRAEMAVEFTGGIRSYFDIEVTNIYDDEIAQKRYEAVNSRFRKDIESIAEELKKKN